LLDSRTPQTMSAMPEPFAAPANASSGSPKGLARRIFSNRLAIGLVFVAVGACIAQPHTLWGEHQVLGIIGSALLVAAGMALRYWAAGSAGTHTHSPEIEGPRLATGGPYAFVRNPIYLGSMVLGLGMVGLIGDARLIPLYIFAFAFLYAFLIPAEERFLQQKFGGKYDAYRSAVPRIIPRCSAWKGKAKGKFHWEAARGELHILAVLVAIYAVLQFGAWAREELG
jgi:protein-S-isoprenylcysteine O-methyltransferase Ste14